MSSYSAAAGVVVTLTALTAAAVLPPMCRACASAHLPRQGRLSILAGGNALAQSMGSEATTGRSPDPPSIGLIMR